MPTPRDVLQQIRSAPDDDKGGEVERAIHAGDEEAFAALAEKYRRQLHVHCYRMVGSFDDAEDLVQETIVRAWRARDSFEGRSLFRTWLYHIATNTCLNALRRGPHKRRVLPQDVVEPVTATTDASQARAEPPYAPEIPWLEPYPDALLQLAAPSDSEPEAVIEARETIELAYVAGLQHLPPRQRAVLVLRDVLGWSSQEVATMIDASVASTNSALQRARSTLRSQLGSGRQDWAPSRPTTAEEESALRQFMNAWERGDAAQLTQLLREDARWAMPPAPLWFEGRDAIARLFALFPPSANGEFRCLPTSANRQPAAATYLRRPGDTRYRFVGVQVLRIDDGAIAEVIAFSDELCGHFGLPREL